MQKKYLNCYWGRSLTTIALFIAPLATMVQAADMVVAPDPITASRSPVFWGQPVTLTANVQQNEVMGDVTFYDECIISQRRKLGVGEFVDGGVQLKIRANQLHLGSNNINIEYLQSEGTLIEVCVAKVITVLPVAQ